MFAWSNGLSRSAGVGLRQSLAGSPQHQAESSSYPAVWLFASGCFPPCLAATRLPSTTSRNIDSRRTFISLTQHTLHRTNERATPPAAKSTSQNAQVIFSRCLSEQLPIGRGLQPRPICFSDARHLTRVTDNAIGSPPSTVVITRCRCAPREPQRHRITMTVLRARFPEHRGDNPVPFALPANPNGTALP